MSEDAPKGQDPNQNPEAVGRRYIWWMLGIAIAAVVIVQLLSSPMVTGEVPIPYSELKQRVANGEVEQLNLTDDTLRATPTTEALKLAQADNPDISFKRWRSIRMRDDESFVPLLDEHGVKYEAAYTEGCEGSFVWLWLLGVVAAMAIWSTFVRRDPMGANPAMSFGRSKAKLAAEESSTVTFNDVAGCEEAKEELAEIVEFLSRTREIHATRWQSPSRRSARRSAGHWEDASCARRVG